MKPRMSWLMAAVLSLPFLVSTGCVTRNGTTRIRDRVIPSRFSIPQGNVLTCVAHLERLCVESFGESGRRWVIDWSLPSVEIVCEEDAEEDLPELRAWSQSIVSNMLTDTNLVAGLKTFKAMEFGRVAMSELLLIFSYTYGCEFIEEKDRVVCQALPPELEIYCYRLSVPGGTQENRKDLIDFVCDIYKAESDYTNSGYVWLSKGTADETWYVMATPLSHAKAVKVMKEYFTLQPSGKGVTDIELLVSETDVGSGKAIGD